MQDKDQYAMDFYRWKQLLAAVNGQFGTLADVLGVSRPTIYKWNDDGRISLVGALLAEDSIKLSQFLDPSGGLYFTASRLRGGYTPYDWTRLRMVSSQYKIASAKQRQNDEWMCCPLLEYRMLIDPAVLNNLQYSISYPKGLPDGTPEPDGCKVEIHDISEADLRTMMAERAEEGTNG